jgi:hypothetical protein
VAKKLAMQQQQEGLGRLSGSHSSAPTAPILPTLQVLRYNTVVDARFEHCVYAISYDDGETLFYVRPGIGVCWFAIAGPTGSGPRRVQAATLNDARHPTQPVADSLKQQPVNVITHHLEKGGIRKAA